MIIEPTSWELFYRAALNIIPETTGPHPAQSLNV
jgi:hypothetical protein